MTRDLPNLGDIICTKTRPDYTYTVIGFTDSYLELIDHADNGADSLRIEVWTRSDSSWIVKERFGPAEKKQVGGDHYTMHKIQPWDIIDAYGLDFYEGNALKYLLRYKDKNGAEDLEKAIHYIERIIEGLKNVQS